MSTERSDEGVRLTKAGALMRQSSAAKLLGVTTSTVHHWVQTGRLASYLVDGRRMVVREEVEAMLFSATETVQQARRTVTERIVLSQLEQLLLELLAESESTPVDRLLSLDTEQRVRQALSRLDRLELAEFGRGRTWHATPAGHAFLASA